MALNSTTKQAIEAFVDGIGTANPVSLDVDNLEFNRTISKKFAKMLSGVKKKQVTLANTDYTLTKEGAVSMVEMFDEGESLAPVYVNGVLDINTDKNVDTVVVGGEFVGVAPTAGNKAATTQITGNSVIISDATFGEYAFHKFVPADGGKVVLENITVDGGENGNLNSVTGSNTPLVFASSGDIVIREMTEVAHADGVTSAKANSIYNGLEIWGNTKADGTFANPTSILIEDCHFKNNLWNNAINIFGMANGAKALIKNCTFDYASNILRIGSVENGFIDSYNCVIEFRDCNFKSWDSNASWGSFGLCQFDSALYYKMTAVNPDDTTEYKLQGTNVSLYANATNKSKNAKSTYVKFTYNNVEYVTANHTLIKVFDASKDTFADMQTVVDGNGKAVSTYVSKNIYGTDSNGTHITIKLVNCTGPDGNKITAEDPTKLFGSDVFVSNVIDGNVVVTNVVDTQHRLMLLYSQFEGENTYIIPPYTGYEAWYPTFVIE